MKEIVFLIFAALLLAAFQRNAVWDNEISLWEDVAKKTPEKARGNFNLAMEYADKGLYKDAITRYQKTLSLRAYDYEAHNNLGVLYWGIDRREDAVKEFQLAIKINQGYGEAHNNLGVAFEEMGMYEKALKEYEIALRIKPDYKQAKSNLLIVLGKVIRKSGDVMKENQ